MAAVNFFFFVLASRHRCVAGRTRKEKRFKKKQSLPASHRMKNKPWFFKTMKKPWF
jgi:hypothetical protein